MINMNQLNNCHLIMVHQLEVENHLNKFIKVKIMIS
jgi:hypothetical protein